MSASPVVQGVEIENHPHFTVVWCFVDVCILLNTQCECVFILELPSLDSCHPSFPRRILTCPYSNILRKY